jgi:NAD/NADP transhydrogenase beta subunit
MDSNLHKLVAFSHSLAGLAAVLISIGNWLVVYPHLATDPQALVHKLAIFFGVFTGGVTFTGSLVGFDKLQGLLLPLARAKPYQLAIMALTSLASLGIFATTESFHLAALALVTATGLSKTLGVTLTHAIPDTNMS